MTRFLLATAVVLFGASAAAAHEITGPDEMIAAIDGAFTYDVTYTGPDFEFHFGHIQLTAVDIEASGSVLYEVSTCEPGYDLLELITTVQPHRPVPVHDVTWTAIKSTFE